MKISESVLKFLDRKDVQNALAQNGMQELYKLVVDISGLIDDIGELTSILMQASVDPLQGMTEIPDYFLYRQYDIKEFNIPRGITKIGLSAFAYTDLESITIPNSVRVINGDAFYKCEDLKTVKLPTGVELHVGAFSFSGLESIELKDVKLQGSVIFYNCKQLKSAVIKGDTPMIPDWTFEGCTNLTHIELPVSLKKIGDSIFLGCSSLKEINFEDTMSQWKNIEVDETNEVLFACSIICSDGTLKYDGDVAEWRQV